MIIIKWIKELFKPASRDFSPPVPPVVEVKEEPKKRTRTTKPKTTRKKVNKDGA